MILYPVVYWHDFRNDFLTWDTGKKIGETMLSLLALHRPFRAPLSIGVSLVRCVSHGKEIFDGKPAAENGVHAALAASAVALSLLVHPTAGFIPAAVSDALTHLRDFLKQTDRKKRLEALSLLVLDLLFLASFTLGSIEITVAAMILQILVDGRFASEHWEKGEYFQAFCQGLITAAHVRQLIPQLHVLRWKLRHQPALTAPLKQDAKGFVYLDIPDEWLNQLLAQFNDGTLELPPYFGDGKAGAHVSAAFGEKLTPAAQQILSNHLGRQFTFQIAHADSVKPSGWEGVRSVWFLALRCPALEALRVRLGLSPRIGGDHDFHVTFGVQREARVPESVHA